jgi:hypothetical protein
MTPIEKAARAIFGEGLLLDRDECIRAARAVLQALREPSDLMRTSGQWAISDNLTVSVCVENNFKAAEVWQAMIDRALSE